MPDITRFPQPATWSDALAALPQEAPDASRWPRITAHMDAHMDAQTMREDIEADETPHSSWRARWTLAASLFALAALPFAWYAFDREPGTQATPTASAEPAVAIPQPPRPAQDATQNPVTNTAAAASTRITSTDTPATSSASTSSPASAMPRNSVRDTVDVRDRAPRHTLAHADRELSPAPIEPKRHPIPVAVANDASLAADAMADAPPLTTATPKAWPDAPVQVDLEQLYDVSAQLETLLALSRDPRVESGPAAALSSDFDAAVALIDDRLALPDLPVAERVSLWQARVETLQQAAGFEGQLRLLSAQGQRFDGTLVGVD